jgi:phenylacetate-CoA ligase
MKILEDMRYAAFWFLDFLKGSKIKRHLRDIINILEHYNSEAANTKRANHLNNLLAHAIKTTDYYKNSHYKTLKDFPVINKNIIRVHKNEFISKALINKKNYKITTSGSTGVPLEIIQDKNKKTRNTADTLYFSKKAGFKLGYRILYLRIWYENLKKHSVVAWIQNIYPINVLELNDGYLSNLLETIKADTSNKGWLGYASGFETLCNYLDRIHAKPMQVKVKSIIAISENLNDYTKQSMAKYFNAPVVSRYSNWENGIIAQQKVDGSDTFDINWASFYIELLQFDKDKPAKSGELGRIIITDLFNYALPMIRYDTGDIGIMDFTTSPPILKKVEGRNSDSIFDTKGHRLSNLIVSGIAKYKGLLQGQLIQESKNEYLLKLNIEKEFCQEIEIIDEFKSYLGSDSDLKVEYVNDIPLLASGKRKVMVNNYSQKLKVT